MNLWSKKGEKLESEGMLGTLIWVIVLILFLGAAYYIFKRLTS